MTIDERLERLTERHEALTQTVEIIASQMQDTDKRIEALAKQGEQTDKRVVQLTDLMLTLTSVVQRHQERLDNIDGGQSAPS